MELNINFSQSSLNKFKQDLADKLEVAAVKGWEAMVERAPAAGEGPYSTGQLRQSIRFQKTADNEYTFYVPMSYGVFVEFGTGPKGRATGAVPDFPNDPQPSMSYHDGQVLVTRYKGHIFEQPHIRKTQGMSAQPFVRPGLLEAVKVFENLMKNN